MVKVGNGGIGIGAGGTIVLGIWLAFSYGGYDIWDPWIIAAIVLWAIAGGIGRAHRRGVHAGNEQGQGARRGGPDGTERRAARAQPDADAACSCTPSSCVVVLLIIIDMIWKPGA